MTVPLIRVRYLLAHVQGHQRMGGDPHRLLRRVDIPEELLESPSALLPLARLNAFTRLAILDVGQDLARQSAPRRLVDFGPLGEMLGRIPSLDLALRTFVTAVKAESATMRFSFMSRPKALWLRWTHEDPGDPLLMAHGDRVILRNLLAIIRYWAGEDWHPSALWLRSGPIPEDGDLYTNGHIRYRASMSAIAIPRPLPHRPIATPSLMPSAHERLDLDAIDFVTAMTKVVEGYLSTGPPSIVKLSRALDMSTRSLQRRLAEAGTTHSRLLDEVRRRAALTRVEQLDQPIGQIADELGYSDQAHFTRAFQRWFGVSPRDLRRTLRRTWSSPLDPASAPSTSKPPQ